MDFAILIAVFVIGAVSGALISIAFFWDRAGRVRIEGDYYLIDGPLSPDRARDLSMAWRSRSDKSRGSND